MPLSEGLIGCAIVKTSRDTLVGEAIQKFLNSFIRKSALSFAHDHVYVQPVIPIRPGFMACLVLSQKLQLPLYWRGAVLLFSNMK